MRHEETFQSARSRQHRSRIVDKQIDFCLANYSCRWGTRWAAKSSQLGRPGAHRAAKSSQRESQGQPDRAIRGQIDPARAPGAARSSQSRPDRASQGEPGRSAGRPGRATIPARKRFTAISLLIRRIGGLAVGSTRPEARGLGGFHRLVSPTIA